MDKEANSSDEALEKLLSNIFSAEVFLPGKEMPASEGEEALKNIDYSSTTLADIGLATGFKEFDRQTLDNFTIDKDDGINKALKNYMHLTMVKGLRGRDVLKCSDEMLETMYAHANTYLEAGRYEDANNLFETLAGLDDSDYRYLMGMAVVSHKTGEYEKAATQYAAASLVNMQQPELFFYASDCYLRLNDPYSAAGSLETCLHICGDDPKWHELKKSAVFTLETIEKGLKDLPAGEKIEPNYRKGGLNDYIRRNPELGDYAEKFFDNDLKFEG